MSKKCYNKCSGIWDYIYDMGEDERLYELYADNINDICAKDLLTDNSDNKYGLTVILPDDKFIKYFIKQREKENINKARKMLKNTIIRHFIPNVDIFDINSFRDGLPIMGGITIKVVGIDYNNNVVILSNNIKIVKLSVLANDKSKYKYAIWKVIEGEYPVDTRVDIHKKNKEKKSASTTKMTIKGGKNEIPDFIVNITQERLHSPQYKRINMLTSFMKVPNILENLYIKCTSLFNWLRIYMPDKYLECLPIVDTNPATTIIIILLDPNNDVITDDILFGKNNPTNPVEYGWQGSNDMVNDVTKEWEYTITQASHWYDPEFNGLDYFNFIQNRIRNSINKVNIDNIRQVVKGFYSNIIPIFKKFVNTKTKEYLDKWYGKQYGSERKEWHDQLRLICTYAFSNLSDMHIVSTDKSEIIQDILNFKPLNVGSYQNAATFSYGNGKENFHMLCKFLNSTEFGYMPSYGIKNNLCTLTSNINYMGVLESNLNTSIVNCHAINLQIVKTIKIKKYNHPSLYNKINWQIHNHDFDSKTTLLSQLQNEIYDGDFKIGQDIFDIRGGEAQDRKGTINDHESTDDEDESLAKFTDPNRFEEYLNQTDLKCSPCKVISKKKKSAKKSEKKIKNELH